MEIDGSGDELAAAAAAAAASTDPGRGRKRPPSPSTPTPSDDGEDSDDGWAVSDSGSEEEEEEYDDEEEQEGMHRPFTVDDFPRLSSDHSVQTDALYDIPHLLTVDNAGTVDCLNGCWCLSMNLLQFIDLRISGYCHTQPGRAKIFGFFAVWDDLEPLRNYVFRHGIDSYEAVSVKTKTGMACLPLTSPARDSPKAEDEPKGGTLIEGCTEFTNILRSTSFTETVRLYGEKCGLGVKFLLLVNAVQATVDVEIIHSRACGLNLKLYAKTSGFSDVLRLFRGVAQSSRKISSVVAVVRRSHLDLCIEGSPADIDLGEKLPCTRWEHRFGAGFHGTVEEVVKLGDFTTISVKVTWKAGLWVRAAAAVAAAELRRMEVDGGGDESSAATPDPGRGKKRPPSPSTPPTPSDDGEDSDDSWAVNDEEEEEEEEDEEDQEGKHRPFTVDDFPRLSSDHSVQTDALFDIPHLRLGGPSPLSLFRAFNDPLTDKRRHWFGSYYRLDDESEISVDSAGAVDCLNGCRCLSKNLLQFIDLKISGYRHTQPGRAKIFGFFAVRDDLEPLRNYVFRHAIDNYEAVSVKPKTLYAKTSGFSDVIRLFEGAAQSGHRISSVVAVVRRSHLDLCIEGSPAGIGLGEKLPRVRWEHRFGAGFHGIEDEVVKLGDFSTISVKVTWKAVGKRPAPKG
uniref:DUF6598 domain-containing protein n=1 Tax=Oryza nivara TaxID=4536 RepID=A0A0E0JBD6_ORYNI